MHRYFCALYLSISVCAWVWLYIVGFLRMWVDDDSKWCNSRNASYKWSLIYTKTCTSKQQSIFPFTSNIEMNRIISSKIGGQTNLDFHRSVENCDCDAPLLKKIPTQPTINKIGKKTETYRKMYCETNHQRYFRHRMIKYSCIQLVNISHLSIVPNHRKKEWKKRQITLPYTTQT